MVLVELKPHRRRSRRFHQRRRAIDRVGEVARHVDGVDRFHQQRRPDLLRQRRRRAQVRDRRALCIAPRHTGPWNPRQRIEQPGPEAPRGRHGVAHRSQELLLASRQGEEAALSARPVAWRGIEQHELDPVLLQRPLDPRGIELMDEEDLDAPEPRLRGGAKAVVHVQLRPEHGEIGGESRHGPLPHRIGRSTVTPAASSQSRTSAAIS